MSEKKKPEASEKRRGRTVSKRRDGPNPVDVHVGLRMRQRRTLIGMSQETLAHHLDMSFQQVQKYECGANRISASRLFLLTRILKIDVSYFFQGLPDTGSSELSDTGSVPVTSMLKRETMELVRAYMGIRDTDVRQQLHMLISVVATPDDLNDGGTG